MVHAMTQARRPRDVIAAVLECLAEHGLRGSWGELQGDEVVVLDLAVPEEDAARVEELLGVPIGAMRFPLAAYPALGDAVRCRTSTVEDSFPSRIISMFPHLTNAEKAVARHHLGAGPLLAAPIADGDALLGVLFAWGPSVVSQRTLVETLAALAGFAWSRVNNSTGAFPERFETASPVSSDVAKNLLELLAPGAIRAALNDAAKGTGKLDEKTAKNWISQGQGLLDAAAALKAAA